MNSLIRLLPVVTYVAFHKVGKHTHQERWAILMLFCFKFVNLVAESYQNRTRFEFDKVIVKIKRVQV